MIDKREDNILTLQLRAALERELLNVRPLLMRLALRLSRNGCDAEDLVQTTMLNALGALARFQPGTSMKNWTGRIMRNSFISGYHRLRREPNVDDEVAAMSVQVAPSQEWAVRSNELRAALDQLPSTNRDAVIRVAMGHSYNDVAASLGCELGTVKSRVSRARHSLTVALGNASNHDAYSACL